MVLMNTNNVRESYFACSPVQLRGILNLSPKKKNCDRFFFFLQENETKIHGEITMDHTMTNHLSDMFNMNFKSWLFHIMDVV